MIIKLKIADNIKRVMRLLLMALTFGGVGGGLLSSCARMGQPDGGWYDENPPRVIGATPEQNATNVKSKKVTIRFDEFIKLESQSEKVMVSPPQMEQPEIKVTGKNIYINLVDSLKPNTTYTIDFSDAIVDNNEGNPMGNYTYAFSTGETIDTLEVSGYVLDASNLEPVKGILVGVYAEGDTIMRRVARTDTEGHFVIRGIAPGQYTTKAVMDGDGDYRFTQRGEKMAFSHEVIEPKSMPDTRQDTLWLDQNHIRDIKVTGYTHFLPDDIVLLAFDHEATDRYYLKYDRTEANRFTLYFTAPVILPEKVETPDKTESPELPSLRLLNAPPHWGGREGVAFLPEPSLKADTVTYWLRDSALVNQDTLMVEMKTYISDSLGVQRLTTDTLEILAKTPYEKRLKAENKEREEWQKDLKKRLRRAQPGEVIDTIMPRKTLALKYNVPNVMIPTGELSIEFPTPLERFDSAAVHLYVEQDSLWYRAPFTITPVKNRRCEVFTDWIEGANYSFEVDSLAFIDIYGITNKRYKQGIQVGKLEDFGSLFVNVSFSEMVSQSKKQVAYVQLLNKQDGVVMTSEAKDGTAEFYYITPGTYYLRAFIDENANGTWDAGDYFNDRQPEAVYYYPEAIECKAKWDLTKSWNLNAQPLYKQKPDVLKKQKGSEKKTIKQRNADRAREKGIELPEKYR